LFSETSWLSVMFGQGLRPKSYHPIVDAYDADGLHKYMNGVVDVVKRSVGTMPSHAEFIKKNCSAKAL